MVYSSLLIRNYYYYYYYINSMFLEFCYFGINLQMIFIDLRNVTVIHNVRIYVKKKKRQIMIKMIICDKYLYNL